MQNRARSNQKLAPDFMQIPSGFPYLLVAFLIAQCQVPCPGGDLFDRFSVYLFQSRWSALVARSQHGLVRTESFLP